MIARITAIATAALAFASLAGCEIQTTSGRAYLERYAPDGTAESMPATDAKVRQVAAVEPTLRFPARIGLARIENGVLSGVPGEEAEAWIRGAERLGPSFGEFVPLSRLVAAMVSSTPVQPRPYSRAAPPLHETMETIRLGAARQHVDAVLVYEVYGTSEQSANILSAFNVTIIGAWLFPGESVSANGFASALLVDVRNGYPYGTARKVVSHDRITPSAGSSSVREQMQRSSATEAAVALVPEVETMLRTLRPALAKLEETAKR